MADASTSKPFRFPTLAEWLVAVGLALALGVGMAGISYLQSGEVRVLPALIVAAFTGAILHPMGFNVRERPAATLSLMSVAGLVIYLIEMLFRTT